MRIVKMALREAVQNLCWVVASCLARQWAIQLKQWSAWLNQSLSPLLAGHITSKILVILALYFIWKAYPDWISCLGMVQQGGLFPTNLLFFPMCPTEKTKSYEHKLKHVKFQQSKRKQLYLTVRLNTVRGCPERLWSLCLLSKLMFNRTQCWATSSNCGLDNLETFTSPTVLWLSLWFCEVLSDSRQQQLARGCLEVREGNCPSLISKYLINRVTLYRKIQGGMLIMLILNQITHEETSGFYQTEKQCSAL